MILLASVLVALAAAEAPAAPAAGILVSIKAPVRVERPGARPAAELGMRLLKGDVVVVGPGGAAMLYLAGGGIERVSDGARFEVSSAAPTRPSSASMKASESGLWVLNDPSGSILVAAMRGENESWDRVGAEPLSPRYETSVTRKPRFVAAGVEPSSRIAVGSGKDVAWRSPALKGNPPWTFEDFPELAAGTVYRWRVESEDGTSLSEWVPFRVPSAGDAEANAAFETEMASLAGTPDGAAAADLLRCGRYLQSSSWTALLGASTRLLAVQPDSTVAKRAKESAERGLRLPAERVTVLADTAK
jgi:hypothetical protein